TRQDNTVNKFGVHRATLLCRGARVGRAALLLLLGTMVVWGGVMANTQPVAAQGFRILIPSISTQGVGPGGASEAPSTCALNAEEQAVAQLMASDPGQQRDSLVCDATLSQGARARARDRA